MMNQEMPSGPEIKKSIDVEDNPYESVEISLPEDMDNSNQEAEASRLEINKIKELEDAYANSGLDAKDLEYIKTVGNPSGDLLKGQAMVSALRKLRNIDGEGTKEFAQADGMADLSPAEQGRVMAQKISETFSPMAKLKMAVSKMFKKK